MRLNLLCRAACWLLCALFAHANAYAQQPATTFVSEPLYDPTNGLTALAFDHQGALFTTEKQGRVLRALPDGNGRFAAPTLFMDIVSSVDSQGEGGLLGLALDPNYANNRYLYLFYGSLATFDQRLVRYKASVNFASVMPGSAKVLLSGLLSSAGIHKGGDIQFSPADPNAIYISLGDDGSSPRIACPSRGDLQIAMAQCPDYYQGKFLKVNAETGLGLPDNPFYNGNPNSIPSRVWAVGFRNPFRFTFHRGAPSADVLYVSENGNTIDRLSRVTVGSNGGWGPCGDNGTCNSPGDVNDGGPFIAPKDPNHKVLLTVSPSLVGIDIATGGQFGTDVLYFGRYGGAIRRLQLAGPNLDQVTALDGGGTFVSGTAVMLKFGPDGHLYYLSTGHGASLGSTIPPRRYRLNDIAPPVAAFTTNPEPAIGLAPLLVQYSDSSSAFGSSITSRAWTFSDGSTASSAAPSQTLSTPGIYSTRLSVTNTLGQQASVTRLIRVLRRVTLSITGQLRDARSWPVSPLTVASELRVYQGDGVTPVPFTGALAPGNALVVNAGGVVNAQITLDLTSDQLVLSAGEAASDGMQPIRQGYVLPAGNGPQAVVLDGWLSDTAVVGRVSDTRGQALAVDVGLRVRGTPYPLANGRDYLPTAGITASGVAHRVLSDALGYFHMALRSNSAGSLALDAVADTGTQTHANPTVTGAIANGAVQTVNIQVGQWDGGLDCTNLSAIPTTPNVDFASQIQPIFTFGCSGCHVPGASYSGGLDLSAQNSLASLIGVVGVRAPGVPRVSNTRPLRSFLFEKINCGNPQSGTRMRPGDPISIWEQALIRDWILQLPLPTQIFRNGFDD